METTSRLGLQYPDETDYVTNYPAVSKQEMTTLDNAAIDLQGVASARPTATVTGRYYFATDTGQLWRDNGTVWTLIFPTAANQSHSWTSDDQTAPNASATVIGSWPIVPAGGETPTIVGAVLFCQAVGLTPSVFALQYDHGAHGTLSTIPGLGVLQPSTTTTLVTATGGPLPLASLDRISLVAVTPGNSTGCTVAAITQHTG